MKRAQGISINTIIIAAIALIVLVVLIAIFTGRMGIFGEGITRAQQGILCVSDSDKGLEAKIVTGTGCKEEGYTQYVGVVKSCDDTSETGCISQGQICCVKR